MRIAVLGSALGLLAFVLPPALGLYLTMLAAAVLLGAGFMAYVTAVDRPSAMAATDLVVCAVIAMLVLADASVRFPSVVSSDVPSASMALAEVALALAIAGSIAAGTGTRVPDGGSRPWWERSRDSRSCGCRPMISADVGSLFEFELR